MSNYFFNNLLRYTSLALLLSSGVAFATVEEGEEAYVLQKHLKDKKMNLCSEELREGSDFATNLKQYHLELGAMAADNAFRFPDDVGTPSFLLVYSKQDNLVEVWPNGRKDPESGPLLQIDPQKLNPVLLKKIKNSKGGHVEEVTGDSVSDHALVGVKGTSPALANLLSVNLDLFCDMRNKNKENVFMSALDKILAGKGKFNPRFHKSESDQKEKAKIKGHPAHH